MALSNNRSLYLDCFEILDKALGRDLRLKFEDRENAMNFRFRTYKARSISREDSKDVYPPDHPSYGRSEYDNLDLQVDDCYLYVTKRNAKFTIEEL